MEDYSGEQLPPVKFLFQVTSQPVGQTSEKVYLSFVDFLNVSLVGVNCFSYQWKSFLVFDVRLTKVSKFPFYDFKNLFLNFCK